MGLIEDRPPGEPVVGWRYWQLGREGLRSLAQRGFGWVPGRILVARCADGGGRGDDDVLAHEAPHADCGCGIHAGDCLASLQAQALCLRPVPLVVGQVALWGRVITEERPDRVGRDHRGQFAAPVRLSVVPETLVGSSPAEAVERLGLYGVAVGTTSLEQAVGRASRTILGHLAMSTATPPGRETGR